jgi:hypothetical protein
MRVRVLAGSCCCDVSHEVGRGEGELRVKVARDRVDEDFVPLAVEQLRRPRLRGPAVSAWLRHAWQHPHDVGVQASADDRFHERQSPCVGIVPPSAVSKLLTPPSATAAPTPPAAAAAPCTTPRGRHSHSSCVEAGGLRAMQPRALGGCLEAITGWLTACSRAFVEHPLAGLQEADLDQQLDELALRLCDHPHCVGREEVRHAVRALAALHLGVGPALVRLEQREVIRAVTSRELLARLVGLFALLEGSDEGAAEGQARCDGENRV